MSEQDVRVTETSRPRNEPCRIWYKSYGKKKPHSCLTRASLASTWKFHKQTTSKLDGTNPGRPGGKGGQG